MSSAPAAPTPTYPRAPSPYFFRRRTLGRAPSPPTWACYEQINSDYGGEFSCSDSDSCDDDDDECAHDHKHDDDDDDDEHSCSEDGEDYVAVGHGATDVESMDVDEAGDAEKKAHERVKAKSKGKQRAIEPEQDVLRSPSGRAARRREKQRRHPVITLRPILTIQKSQGFVWNQDLFVPPYIKDRYIASTSPPNSMGFISTSASSANTSYNEYEVEVVEIRVREGELEDIIP